VKGEGKGVHSRRKSPAPQHRDRIVPSARGDAEGRGAMRPSRKSPNQRQENAKRTPPKREGKYFNTKKADQRKINEMFDKVYGEKKKTKKRK